MRFPALALALALAASPAGAADSTYEVSQTDAKGPVGTPLKASVVVKSKQGWHLNQDAPFTLKLTPGAGVQAPKPKLVRSDLARSTDTEARFEVPFTVTEPGRKTVAAEAGFVLCQESACRPIREKLTLGVEAEVPPATPPKGKKSKKKS